MNLSSVQQGQLLLLAEKLINADGVADDNEKTVLDTMKKECSPDVESK